MSREEYQWWRRLMTQVGVVVLAATIVAVASGVWGMYTQIQSMESDNRLWQERVSNQLDSITERLNEAYTESEAAQDRRQVDRRLDAHTGRLDMHDGRLDVHDGRLDEHEARIQRLEE